MGQQDKEEDGSSNWMTLTTKKILEFETGRTCQYIVKQIYFVMQKT
jgi:hypothetical protein